ncbi:hypothetical protein WJX74_000406 [Apatococcus lobatus]|uniref:SUN domain-containing protein n=1 Tax=Apatococcus lobatus TaxID=904363 RepID=A0AAW1S4Z6_9CHLO
MRFCSDHLSRWNSCRVLCLAIVWATLSSHSAHCVSGTAQPTETHPEQPAEFRETVPSLPEPQGLEPEPDADSPHTQGVTGTCCQIPHFLETFGQPEEASVCDLEDTSQQDPSPGCEPLEPTVLASKLEEAGAPSHEQEGANDGVLLTEGKPDEEEEDGDRHNFASAKDGAKIVAANKDAKKPTAVLDSDSDTYLRNECKVDKWLAIELSQVAKIDAIELGQYELYSSRIKDFELSVTLSNVRSASKASSEEGASRILNSPHWQPIANFTAAKLKGMQTFRLRQPTWCKFLLLRWLNQHGTEPVCALNDLRVFGKSAAEDLEDRLAGDMGSHPLADTPQPAVGTAWIPPIEGGNYGNAEAAAATAPVRLAPSTAEVIETLSPNASAPQEPVHPHPPHHAPPGMQPKPAEASEPKLMETIPVNQPPSDPGAAVPAGQRAVLLDPPSGMATLQPDESLPGNGAGSSKQRNGGSVYDMLVQEIKATKLQQKTLARQLQDLQQDLSGSSQHAAVGVSSLREELAEIRQQVMTCAALEPPSTSNATDLMHAETTLQLGLLHQELRSLHARMSVSQAQESNQQTALLLVLAILAGMLLVCMQALPHLPWLSRLALMGMAAGNGVTGFWLIQAVRK